MAVSRWLLRLIGRWATGERHRTEFEGYLKLGFPGELLELCRDVAVRSVHSQEELVRLVVSEAGYDPSLLPPPDELRRILGHAIVLESARRWSLRQSYRLALPVEWSTQASEHWSARVESLKQTGKRS